MALQGFMTMRSVFRTQTVEVARAEAEKIKKVGAAEAYSIEVVGKAEAERMRAKAAVYKQYGDAAIMSLVLDALPKVRNVLPLSPGLFVCVYANWLLNKKVCIHSRLLQRLLRHLPKQMRLF